VNLLQTFLARANAQSRSATQELAIIEGKEVWGTFGDAQPMPVMTATGYQDHIVMPFKAEADQFAAVPEAHQYLERPQTKRKYFIQMVDYTNPVVYTFILVDRHV
jgi:hypothetical protein